MNKRVFFGALAITLGGSAFHSEPLAPSETPPFEQASLGVDSAASAEKFLCHHFECKDEHPLVKGTRFLIAIVPDPYRTQLPLQFDRFLESIQRAVEQSGYAFDSYWLPWLGEKPREKYSEQQEQRKEQAERLGQPGVLLFRGQSYASERLVVLLIGESPVSGVDGPSFAMALNLIQDWNGNPSIQILGPTFSGSLPSLQLLLTKHADRHFQIVSGSTTDYTAIDGFKQGVQAFADFATVIHSDAYAIERFFDYLKSNHIRENEAALILSEDGTHYGKQFANQPNTINIRFPREISRFRNAYPEGSGQNAETAGGQVPRLQFLPLHLKDSGQPSDSVPVFSANQMPVSQQAVLREVTATLQREKIKFAGIAATDPLDMVFLARFLRTAAPDTRLFVFDADLLFSESADSVPLTGIMSVTTYPLMDRNQSWNSLRKYGDRENRIVFPSRYAEGVYNACRALLLAHTHSSAGSVLGKYSTRYSTDLLDYVRFDDASSDQAPLWLTVLGTNGYWPLAYLTPKQSEKTNLLLPWQVAQIAAGAIKVRPKLDPPSRAWLFGLYVLTFVCLGAAGLLVAGSLSLKSRWYLLLSVRSDQSGYLARAFFLSSGAFALATVYVAFAFPLWVPHADRYILPFPAFPSVSMAVANPPDYMPWVSQLVSMGLIAASFVPSGVLLRRYRSHVRKHLSFMAKRDYALAFASTIVFTWSVLRGYAAPMLVIPLLLVVLLAVKYRRNLRADAVSSFLYTAGILNVCVAFVWVMAWGYKAILPAGEHQAGLFFLYRSMWFSSGVSPTLPLMITCMGLAYGAWVHLQRHIAVLERRPAPPTLGPAQHSLLDRIENTLNRSIFSKRELILGCGLGMIALNTVRFLRHNQTLEGMEFDRILGLSVFALEVVTYFAWSRFVFLWTALRRLLHFLEQSRLRDAFSRFPASYSWSTIWRGNGAMRRYYLIQRALESLTAIKYSAAEPLKTQVASTLQAVGPKVAAMVDDINHDEQLAIDNVNSIQDSLRDLADLIIKDLQANEWAEGKSDSYEEMRREKPGEETTDAEKEELASHKLQVLKEEFVANRYLAYLRYVLVQMNNLLALVIGGFVTGIIALNTYPFQSRRLMDTAAICLLLLLGSGVVAVFMQMDRNQLLSRISKTRPGHLDSGFFLRVVSYGTLPLLTVMASQFPAVGHFLFSWIEPALEALR